MTHESLLRLKRQAQPKKAVAELALGGHVAGAALVADEGQTHGLEIKVMAAPQVGGQRAGLDPV